MRPLASPSNANFFPITIHGGKQKGLDSDLSHCTTPKPAETCVAAACFNSLSGMRIFDPDFFPLCNTLAARGHRVGFLVNGLRDTG